MSTSSTGRCGGAKHQLLNIISRTFNSVVAPKEEEKRQKSTKNAKIPWEFFLKSLKKYRECN